MSSQGFILYSFIKLSKNESLRSLLVIFVDLFCKFLFQFLVNILKLFKGAKSDFDHIKEENVKKQLKFSIFLFLTTLTK